MTTNTITLSAACDDAELVSASLSGNRDAFGRIVSRYQSLICSLAYSATGSLGQSEDLAQETFITAWKHLSHLREQGKFRAWLCGIARNRINNFLRREGRNPISDAGPLEDISESHSSEPLPRDHTISKEEEAILWRSLERIPELYREPLVLFYREHQSIETVAANLELTEDTVKQRLSRGRKLLQEQVLSFVEGALERTNPGKAFTVAVLASLPALTFSAKAATVGAAAKGATAKLGGAGLFGWLMSPLMTVFGNALPYFIAVSEARSDEERRRIKSSFHKLYGISFVLSIAFVTAFCFIFGKPESLRDLFMGWFVSWVVIYLLAMFVFVIATSRKRRVFYSKALAEEHGGVFPKPAFEYCSKITFLGLPLVHIRIGDRFDLLRKPVKGWIVMANYAIGGLFAFGGVAIAPFSIAALPVGLVALGGIPFGAVTLGALSFGVWAFGAIAVGWQSVGACAIAWSAASGDIALAHQFATGHIAHALQANTDAARQFIGSNLYFRCFQFINRHWFWVNFLWITPLFIQWRLIARQRRGQTGA